MFPRSVHAQVIGEHGDSSVTLWSGVRVGGSLLRDWQDWDQNNESRLSKAVRTAAYEIIRRKGATNHAIGLVTATLLRWMLRGERRVVNVSHVQDGPFNLQNVALSLPAVVGREGVVRIIKPQLSAEEEMQLKQSAEVLSAAMSSWN
jgi:L-lactate dehydrogenase